MDWIVLPIIGGVATLIGIIGCFVPVLPGPLVSYLALWILYALGYPPSTERLAVGAAVLLVVMTVDYVLPSYIARKFNCSRWGVFGCFAGGIVGLFFLPLGVILGPFLGTVIGELIAGKNVPASLRGGLGALLGCVLCVGLKLVSVGLFAWWYFAAMPLT